MIGPKLLYYFPPIDATLFNYPRWKDLLNDKPTADDFHKAWELVFGCDFDKYQYKRHGSTVEIVLNFGFVVHDGFGEYTDDPLLGEEQTFYYAGAGCSWDIDILGEQFPLIDPKTILPYDWEKVKAIHVIKRWMCW